MRGPGCVCEGSEWDGQSWLNKDSPVITFGENEQAIIGTAHGFPHLPGPRKALESLEFDVVGSSSQTSNLYKNNS